MIGAVLYDRLVGARLDNPGALELGSTVPAGPGWSPNGVITASLLVTGKALSQPETGSLRALSQSKLVTPWCVTALPVTGRALSQLRTGRLRALSQSTLVTRWCYHSLTGHR